MTSARKHWPILFLLLIPLLPLYRAVFLGEAIGPFDQIRQMAPWNGPKPEQPWDVLQADSVIQFYGWRDLVFESWSRAEAPFRNPYQLAGTPLLANSQSGGFYPPHIVVGLLHLPTGAAIALLAWLHLFWAGVGAYLLSRRLGAREVGGAVAGAGFALSAFSLAWLPLASVPTTIAWIPWVLVCILDLVPAARRGTPVLSADETAALPTDLDARSQNAAIVGRIARLALCVGMLLLAGHLQFAAFGLLAGAVLTVCLAAANFRSRQAWLGAGGVLLAFAFGAFAASPQLLAVLEFSKFSHRRSTPSEEGFQAYLAGAIAPAEAVGLLFPSLLGDPTTPSEPGSPISTYYPSLEHRGANFAETAAGIGPLVFIGLLFVPWRRLRAAHAAFGALGILALLVAFGTPIDRLLYFGVPGWSATGSPGRCAVLLVLAASVLAGVGITRIELERPSKRSLSILLGVGGLAAAASIWIALQHAMAAESWIPAVTPQTMRAIAAQAVAAALPGIVVVLLAGTLGVQAKARGIKGAEGLILGAAALTPFLTLGPGFLRTGSPDLKADLGVEKHERAAFVNDNWELLAAAPYAAMPPNTASILRIHDIAGYDSLMHRDSVRMVHDVVGADAAPPANGNMQLLKSSFDRQKLADAGVTQLFSVNPIPNLGDPVQTAGLLRYRLLSRGRAFTEKGPAEIIEESNSSITVKAQGRHLTVRDMNLPGWRASVNGRSATLGSGSWLEVDLPGEECTVVFQYVPPGYHPAELAVMPLLLAVWLVPAAMARRRTKARPPAR